MQVLDGARPKLDAKRQRSHRASVVAHFKGRNSGIARLADARTASITTARPLAAGVGEGSVVGLLELVTALFALVGPQLSVQYLDRPVRFTDLYGAERQTTAALECRRSGQPVLYVGPGVDLLTLAHELAHAHDCADDGKLNASPIGGARPAQRPTWASDYCWKSDAEWYACWVVHSGRVDVPPARDEPRPRSRAAILRRPLAMALAIIPRR